MSNLNLKGSNLILNSMGSSCQPIPNKPSFLSFPLCRRKTLLPLPIAMSNLNGSNLILNYPGDKRTLVFHQRSIETIQETKLRDFLKPLQDLGNPTDLGSKYHPKLRSYSHTLPRLDSIYKTSDNAVKVDPGCGVNLWVRSYLDYDDDYDKKVVWFESNSDCVRIHCVASILLRCLSGRPLSKLTPDFFKRFIQTLRSTCRESRYIPYLSTESDDFDMLDILQNMLELIQCQCLILEEAGYVSDYGMDFDDEAESVECWIKEKLERGLSPVKLDVEEFVKLNFSIVIVSREFLGKTYAERESMIHSLLKEDDYSIELPPFSVSIIAAKEPI